MFSVESQGAVDVVKPVGPLNVENAPGLLDTVATGLSEGLPMVVVDLTEVALIDSAGLEALVDAREKIQLKGGSIKLACLNPLCQEILRITQIDQQFELFTDPKAAVGSFVR